jgi:hypothetical protein
MAFRLDRTEPRAGEQSNDCSGAEHAWRHLRMHGPRLRIDSSRLARNARARHRVAEAQMSARVLIAIALASSTALAQLPAGWSVVDRTGISSPEAIACTASRVAIRDWSGMVATSDGGAWTLLRRGTVNMYGRTLAMSGDHIFLAAGDSIAEWNGTTWIDHALPTWEGELPAGLVATSPTEVYYVGRGRIAVIDASGAHTYDAGTWRSLNAISIANGTIWIGGQGGTILRREAGADWTREATGIDSWVRSIVAFARDDVWALAEGARYDQSTVIHYDGHTWSRQEAGIQGTINAISTTNQPAVYATGQAGLMRWDGHAWVVEIAQSALGNDAQYYGMHGVCATDRQIVVGFGPRALIRAR